MSNEEIAEKLDNAAFNATAIPQVSQSNPIELSAAYEIQKYSLQRRYNRGEKKVGIKMGFTSKAKMEQMGVHDLIWGRLTDGMFYKLGSDLRRDKFIHPRAEPEIAFKLAEDITDPVTLDTVKSYVSHVAIAIEIIDSRYENFKFSLEDVVADNCSSAAFTLGEWMPVTVGIENILMSLVRDDIIEKKGNSNAILGNPWESLVAAVRLSLENKEPLSKDDIVLAGAATPAIYIKPGDTISAHAEGLGSVYLDII